MMNAPMIDAPGETPATERMYYASLACLAAGFPALALIDARAENAWTFFACGAVIMGYILMGASILGRRD